MGAGLLEFHAELGTLVGLIDDVNFLERSHWPSPPGRAVRPARQEPDGDALIDGPAIKRTLCGRLDTPRTSFDVWLRLIFISCYPAEPYAALTHRLPKGVVRFNATGFIKDQLRLDWHSMFEIMSAFTHGNTIEALESLQAASDRRGAPERLGLTSFVEQGSNRTCLPIPRVPGTGLPPLCS